MKKGAKVGSVIVILVFVLSIFISVVSAEDVSVDLKKSLEKTEIEDMVIHTGDFESAIALSNYFMADSDPDLIFDNYEICIANPDSGRKKLVEAIEELEQAILDSIDYDIQQVADSYALLAAATELTPWWRELARLALDTISAVVGTAINVGEFLTPEGANQVLEDASTSQQIFKGLKDSKEILGDIAISQGLVGLYRNADSYKILFEAINKVEEVARQEYKVSEDFARTANAAWLELWLPSTPNGLLIPLKTGTPMKEGSRSSVTLWVNGIKEMREEVKNSFDNVINEIPDPLPADYPLDETITYINNLKQQVKRGRDFQVVEFKGVKGGKEIERHITLGLVKEGREVTDDLYDAWMHDLDVQYTSTVYKTGKTIMHVTTYGFPATGVTKKVIKGVSDLYEVVDIIHLPSDLVNLIDKPVHPLDALQYHLVKMNNDLVHETSNLWALSEETLLYLKFTWERGVTPTPPIPTIDVPFKAQVPPGSWDKTKNCGQACSSMVFCYYWNTEPSEEDIKKIDNWLYEKYGDPIDNYNGWETTTTKLKTLACEYANFPKSYKASGWNLEKLKQEIDAGHPVIVAIVAGKIPYRKKTDPDVIHYRNYNWEGGHFVVVKGYTSDCIICNDPATSLGDGKQYYNNDFKAAMDAQGGAVVVVIPGVILPSEAKPVLTSPLRITPEIDKYYVGDTIRAEFTINNIGGAPITLDKLLVGGRFNDGMLPNGEYPDFTSQTTTLQSNGQYRYTGTLTLTRPGNYHFFIAYYIENPTSEEKKLLDENNWNTCVDLGEGLTDADRIEDIRVFPQLERNVLFIPDDYPTIQAAVNAANAGDTIIVREGTYYENVDIGKSLTFKSSSDNPKKTVVQGFNPNDHVFEITADHVNISGFTVEEIAGSKALIFLNGVNYCNISNNHILNNTGEGILLDSSKSNTVFNNTFSGDSLYSCGICVNNSTNNLISDNTISNYGEGIVLYYAKNNTIFKNSCKNNWVGIILLLSNDNIVSDNVYRDNNIGIRLKISSGNNTIANNICESNKLYYGISLDFSSNNNTITGNTVSKSNGDGISLCWDSSDNIISGNNVSNNNGNGISLRYSSNNNHISLNNFIDNTASNVYSEDSTNIWNSPEEITYSYNGKSHTKYLGNYWSDYTGTDANKNGIGDKSYSIKSDKDNYPLIEPFENYIDEVEEPTEFLVAVSNPAGAYICNDTADFTFDRNLKRGDSGDDVMYLQIVLNANPATQVAVEGSGSPCHETNYFGQLTETAVIKFQTLHEGLTQTGEIDDATRAELNKLYLPVKHVPNGWVLNVTNTAQNEEIHDGCLWWEVEDVTDGIKGWVAYQNDATKYLVIGDQGELNDKIKQLNTKGDRIPVILHAVTEHRTEFLPANFPRGIILAMIAQEAPSDFDNEFVSFDCGRGIMQTTTNEYVGCGSGIECYSNGAECLQYTHVTDKELTIFDENEDPISYCHGSCCYDESSKKLSYCSICNNIKNGENADDCGKTSYCEEKKDLNWRCTCRHNNNRKCKHYTNTIQGIEANIRDGLYVLRDKYNCQCCYDRSNDAEWDEAEGLYREEMGDEVIFYSREEECKGSDGLTYDSRIEKIKIGNVQISCNEFKVVDAVWRYNGRSINDYLSCVADRLNEIERIFGYEMLDRDIWIECLKAVSRSASVMKRIK